jgi:hypothetical protein
MTPPDESLTNPESRELSDCANALTENNKIKPSAPIDAHRTLFPIELRFVLFKIVPPSSAADL